VGKRHRRIRARSATGQVAGAATEKAGLEAHRPRRPAQPAFSRRPLSQSTDPKPGPGRQPGLQAAVSCPEIRRYDETAREPLRCYCSSVEYESELVGQQDYRASSFASVSGLSAVCLHRSESGRDAPQTRRSASDLRAATRGGYPARALNAKGTRFGAGWARRRADAPSIDSPIWASEPPLDLERCWAWRSASSSA
jgi:hypothetical protein